MSYKQTKFFNSFEAGIDDKSFPFTEGNSKQDSYIQMWSNLKSGQWVHLQSTHTIRYTKGVAYIDYSPKKGRVIGVHPRTMKVVVSWMEPHETALEFSKRFSKENKEFKKSLNRFTFLNFKF